MASRVSRRVLIHAGFDPSQPRDDHGRWTRTGFFTKPTPDEAHAEMERQRAMAAANAHPLANQPFVLGMENDVGGETVAYVSAYGQEFPSQDTPAMYGRGTPRECYKNASLLVVGNKDLTYAEGWGIPKNGLAFMHAWAVDKQGKVVDNTWEDSANVKYFGVKYDREKYLKALYRKKVYGVLGGEFDFARHVIETGGRELR